MMNQLLRPGLLLTSVLLLALPCPGEYATVKNGSNKVKPGDLIVDHPTLINLGFEWVIQGDDNHNSRVDVSYYKQGETQWTPALPLLRLHGERIYQKTAPSRAVPLPRE